MSRTFAWTITRAPIWHRALFLPGDKAAPSLRECVVEQKGLRRLLIQEALSYSGSRVLSNFSGGAELSKIEFTTVSTGGAPSSPKWQVLPRCKHTLKPSLFCSITGNRIMSRRGSCACSPPGLNNSVLHGNGTAPLSWGAELSRVEIKISHFQGAPSSPCQSFSAIEE